MTFEFETEFNGEFREFKNCKKKSEDFAGNNLIFYIFLITFFRFEKAQIWRFDGEIEEKNIEKLTGENFTWFIASPKEFISCPCSRFRPLLPESGYFAESFRWPADQHLCNNGSANLAVWDYFVIGCDIHQCIMFSQGHFSLYKIGF